MSRPVTRPENPKHRGIRNSSVHQNPFEQWTYFCKKQHDRTVKEKGCKIAFSDPPVTEYYHRLLPEQAMTERYRNDPEWSRTIEKEVRDRFPHHWGYAV